MRPATKARVLAAIDALGYVPARRARSLRSQRSQAFAVLLPDISNPFFSLLARGVESVASDAGFSTLICDSGHSTEKEDRHLKLLLEERVGGIVFVPVAESRGDSLHRLLNADIRIVVADRQLEGLVTVTADNISGSADLVKYLAGLGYLHVAYIAGPPHVSTARDRLVGFQRAMDLAGLEPVEIRQDGFTFDAGRKHAADLLRRQNVDAIVTGNDLMALGAISAAEDCGLPVPGGVGIAGFDNVPWASLLRPPLTTVEVPAFEIGARAAGRLLGSSINGSIVLPTRLVVGGTCVRQPGSPWSRRDALSGVSKIAVPAAEGLGGVGACTETDPGMGGDTRTQQRYGASRPR